MRNSLLIMCSILASIPSVADWSMEDSVFLKSSTSRTTIARLQSDYPSHWEDLKTHLIRIENHFHHVKHKCFSMDQSSFNIPKVIHFIWLGPRELSKEYLFNIQTWHELHPSYQLILWTDRPRELSTAYLEIQSIDFLELQLEEEFKRTVTYAEKADILRYEILQQRGGIYVDIDVECHRSFDPLMQHFSFFVGMEDVWPMVDHYYLKTCNAIIGSTPDHPLWDIVLNTIKKKWSQNTDVVQSIAMEWHLNSYLKQILSFKRCGLPFIDAVLHYPLTEQELIVPPDYFGLQGALLISGLFCTHQYAGTWK